MTELIRLDALSYSYEDGRQALEECSVSICAGEKIAVLGRNGAGKSTFFLLANGVYQAQSGQISLEGSPIRYRKKDLLLLRRRVGLIFQDPDVQLLAGSVEEEISFGPMNLGLSEEEVRRRVDKAIALMDLESLRKRAPHDLSGGEKKRVSIADVLAMQPKLLLLDEPTASLDPEGSRRLEETLAMLSKQGLALAVATHDVDFAWRWAQRILLFDEGNLIADDAPEPIFQNQALLSRCALQQPLLLQTGTLLGLHPLPHSMEELSNQLRSQGGNET